MAKRRNTTARKKKIVPTTIPELKRSFDAIEAEATAILKETPNKAQRIKKFQEAWKKIFGRPVEATAADAYLTIKARKPSFAGKKTRRAKQRGGSAGALAGAPLDYATRPGVDGVYGSFPQYMSQGLSFYNTINQNAMLKDCGVPAKDITPNVPADMGSNQFGGGILGDAISALSARPVTASSPPGILQDMQDAWSGRPLGQSPSPDQTQLHYK
jgi:hypothetical protein